MVVKGLIWLGTRTENFTDTVAFAERVLGMTPTDLSPGLALFPLADGSAFEVFGPDHPGGGHPARGVVGGFEVDDVASARDELVAEGVEVSELEEGAWWCWAYFRASDGNLYEIAGRRGA